jgi:hypothetical protein
MEGTMSRYNKSDGPVQTTQQALAPHQAQARAIEETSAAAVLATCLGKTFGTVFNSNAFKAYRDKMLEAAGHPTDPIEVMMVEQLLWAHHRVGDLHAQAAVATTMEAADMYSGAAVRLMAEYRKTSLALKEYRTPPAPKTVTVVQQQNLAAGDQQVAYIEGKGGNLLPEKGTSNNELCNMRKEALTYEPETIFIPQSQAGGSREAELVETRAVDARRTKAASAIHAAE